jgi:hypothetical protein
MIVVLKQEANQKTTAGNGGNFRHIFQQATFRQILQNPEVKNHCSDAPARQS